MYAGGEAVHCRVFHKNIFLGHSYCTKFILGPQINRNWCQKMHFPQIFRGRSSSREGGIFGKNAFPDNNFCWPQFLQFDFCEPVYCTVRWKPTPKNVSRMARMAGVSPEDPEERMKDEKMPRRGSTALWNFVQPLSSVLWTDATEHDEWLYHFSACCGVFRD